MTNAKPRYAAHTQEQWPHGLHANSVLDYVHQALHGAIYLAWMLEADDNIRADDESAALPLNPASRSGLMSALVVCLHTAMFHIDNDVRRNPGETA